MTGAGEAMRVRGEFALVPVGFTCRYVDPRSPDDVIVVAQGPEVGLLVAGGVALIVAAPFIWGSRSTRQYEQGSRAPLS